VSVSLAPEPPEAARELFGATLPQAAAYAAMLAGPGVQRGLIGPGETGRIWDRHLINSGLVAELLPVSLGAGNAVRPGASDAHLDLPESRSRFGPARSDAARSASAGCESGSLADLGSGAGLPGLVLAILRPDLHVTLIEPMARRTAFLTECVTELDLRNVAICRARAEDLPGQYQADVVTSRAVARLSRLAELSIGICRPGGLVLAMKGASAAAELAEARPVLGRLGVSDARVVTAGQDLALRGLVQHPATVVRLRVGRGAKAARGRSRHEHPRTGT
jgi:16S rRNA (guanine527-N7)-methyltransferase